MNALLENDLSGIATIQSFTVEEVEKDRLESLSQSYRGQIAGRLSAAFVPMIRMAILLGFTATFPGGWITLEGTLAVGAYSVLVFMTQRLLWALKVGNFRPLPKSNGFFNLESVLDLLASPLKFKKVARPEIGQIAKSDIKVKDLSFLT